MIYTSYFDNLKNLPENVIPVAICGKAPDWYEGIQYKKLAPKWEFFKVWKENHDNKYYEKCFSEQVLDKLDSLDVVTEIYELLSDLLSEEQKNILEMVNCPAWENPYIHIALICYEKPDEFCHRHLVADWFNECPIIKCEEWDENKAKD